MVDKQINYTDNFKKREEFSLHDSVVKEIKIENGQLSLYFKEGFYKTDQEGNLTEQKTNCKVIYDFLYEENIEINISIVKFTNRKYKTISFDSFLKILKNEELEVLFEFRSDFLKAVIITGNIGKNYFEFKIYDIKKITYLYD